MRFFIIFLFLLNGCNFLTPSEEISKVRIVTALTYPEFPPIEPLPPADLRAFSYDYPRDKDGKVLKDSNIFVGLDKENWERLVENFDKLNSYSKMCQVRIDEVNRQRNEWLEKAKAEQAK